MQRRVGLSIATALTAGRLAISTKSVVTASNRRLANVVAGALRQAGQHITAVPAADDLGVTSACGARRAIGALKKRISKGLTRSRRVRQLVKVNPKAAKLYQAGVRPQQSYGSSVSGASPEQVRSMRRAAVNCVAPAGAQPCTTTILAWRLSKRRDPAIASPLEQVQLWMRLWARATPAQRKEIRIAWARALPKVVHRGVKWAQVAGPLQATMAVLGQVGWHPVAPDHWFSAGGTELAELDWAPFANAGIREALAMAFEQAAWRSAAQHLLGGGL